jgi:exonuclease SbcC
VRPVRLVLEGFSAFRTRTELDFGDIDLFALVGPTGAGKSSVIDGITFALYGAVARYGDERLVAPVINQRSASAKVDLIFTVGDERFRVFREVTRRGGRATTKEARLERVDDGGTALGAALAGDAKEVSAQVATLLGLDFSQFTTCVVLPQGDFARFLHETPGNREALLKRLLDLGVYDEVGKRARGRAAHAQAQLELLDAQLAEHRSDPGDEPEALAARVEVLGTLLAHVDDALPAIEAWQQELVDAEREAAAAERQVERLASVAAPADIDSLAEAVATIDLELATARDALAAAEERVEAVDGRVAELPAKADLEAAAARRTAREQLAARVETGRAKTELAEREAAEAAELVVAAAARATVARAALDAGRQEHAAHALADGLVVGDPCPVCLRALETVPSHDLADLDRLRSELEAAELEHTTLDASRNEVDQQLAGFRSHLAALFEQLAALDAEIESDPSPAEVVAALAAWDEIEAERRAARAARDAGREQERAARSRRDKVDKLMHSAWGQFDEARDRLGGLQPPPADRDDLAGSWRALLTWCEQQHGTVQQQATSAREAVARLTRQRDEGRAAVVRACEEAGVTVGDRSPRDVLVEVLATTDAARIAAETRRAEMARRLDERDELADRHRVAEDLGRVLRSGGFITWLLQEAVVELLAGATRRLRQLSHGRYSLAADDKGGFLVVDHGNADERRLARSLSGGETFLASLALALALADEVARLSAVGAPRLESIFLDEGFGTLDPDTLDVVVSAIEELQSEGRLVGLVSHVAEVADRVPVRFEVRKDPADATSTVERVVV